MSFLVSCCADELECCMSRSGSSREGKSTEFRVGRLMDIEELSVPKRLDDLTRRMSRVWSMMIIRTVSQTTTLESLYNARARFQIQLAPMMHFKASPELARP
jgi:hypothetical protein